MSDYTTADNCENDEYSRVQLSRLKKTAKLGFYMETIYIAYTIIDDYTELVLVYAGLWSDYLKKRRGHEPAFDSKIRFIQTSAMQKKTLMNKYFSDDLLDNIVVWKNERNKLLHCMLKQSLTTEYMESVALEGKKLAEIIRIRGNNLKKIAKK